MDITMALTNSPGMRQTLRLYKAVITLFCILITLASQSSYAVVFDHELFNAVLKEHVNDGRVNYPGISADPRYQQYLARLEVQTNLTGRDATLAYWINAYNALAIKGILDGRSPSTFFGRIGYFKNAKYRVGGRTIDLYDLERKVIIPLDELRIHFAINCASGSCPKLDSEAYTADNLEQKLDANARHFINDVTRNRFDRDNKVAHLSKIFDWFEKDFKMHTGSVQRYLALYVDDPVLARQLRDDSYTIKYLTYDWSLNGNPPDN